MEKVYWLRFYEDGKFVSAIGNPYGMLERAEVALTSYGAEFAQQGFQVRYTRNAVSFDRNGTLCTLKIEEE